MKVSKAKLLKSKNVTAADVARAKAAAHAAWTRLAKANGGGVKSKGERAKLRKTAVSLHAQYASLKAVRSRQINGTSKRSTKSIQDGSVISKRFVLNGKSHSVSFDVLLVNTDSATVAVYNDAPLKAYAPNVAKRVERLLDEKIRAFAGCDTLHQIALMK